MNTTVITLTALRAVERAPTVVMSAGLWLMLVAVVPPAVGLLVLLALVAGVVVAAVAGTGRVLLVWMLPWRCVMAVVAPVGRCARRVPLVGFAWSVRAVVGAVAVVQSVSDGRVASAVIVAVFVVATYVVPAAPRAADERERALKGNMAETVSGRVPAVQDAGAGRRPVAQGAVA